MGWAAFCYWADRFLHCTAKRRAFPRKTVACYSLCFEIMCQLISLLPSYPESQRVRDRLWNQNSVNERGLPQQVRRKITRQQQHRCSLSTWSQCCESFPAMWIWCKVCVPQGSFVCFGKQRYSIVFSITGAPGFDIGDLCLQIVLTFSPRTITWRQHIIRVCIAADVFARLCCAKIRLDVR